VSPGFIKIEILLTCRIVFNGYNIVPLEMDATEEGST
jgi:hypothetical protein